MYCMYQLNGKNKQTNKTKQKTRKFALTGLTTPGYTRSMSTAPHLAPQLYNREKTESCGQWHT